MVQMGDGWIRDGLWGLRREVNRCGKCQRPVSQARQALTCHHRGLDFVTSPGQPLERDREKEQRITDRQTERLTQRERYILLNVVRNDIFLSQSMFLKQTGGRPPTLPPSGSQPQLLLLGVEMVPTTSFCSHQLTSFIHICSSMLKSPRSLSSPDLSLSSRTSMVPGQL